jgi:hypothetical protein
MFKRTIGIDQSAQYEIRVQGNLKADLRDWFQGESQQRFEEKSQHASVGTTVIIGIVADQAALFGLLMHLRDLGLVLLSVNCLSAHELKDAL